MPLVMISGIIGVKFLQTDSSPLSKDFKLMTPMLFARNRRSFVENHRDTVQIFRGLDCRKRPMCVRNVYAHFRGENA